MSRRKTGRGADGGEAGRELPSGVKLLHTLEAHSAGVNSLAFDPQGNTLASGSADTTVRLWDTQEGTVLLPLEAHTGAVNTVAFDFEGRVLASGSSDSSFRLWDTSSGEPLLTSRLSSGVMSLAFDPRGRALGSGSVDNSVNLWEPDSGKLLQTLRHQGCVLCVAFDPTGCILATAGYFHEILLWNPATGGVLRTLVGHQHYVSSVAFHPAGNILASGSHDRTVKLWDSASGELLGSLEEHTDVVDAVAFLRDGTLMASKSRDGTVRLWRCDTWQPVAVIKEPTSQRWFLPALAFHPIDPILATGGSALCTTESERGKLIHLWELDLNQLLRKGAVKFPASGRSGWRVIDVGDGIDDGINLYGEFDEQVIDHALNTLCVDLGENHFPCFGVRWPADSDRKDYSWAISEIAGSLGVTWSPADTVFIRGHFQPDLSNSPIVAIREGPPPLANDEDSVDSTWLQLLSRVAWVAHFRIRQYDECVGGLALVGLDGAPRPDDRELIAAAYRTRLEVIRVAAMRSVSRIESIEECNEARCVLAELHELQDILDNCGWLVRIHLEFASQFVSEVSAIRDLCRGVRIAAGQTGGAGVVISLQLPAELALGVAHLASLGGLRSFGVVGTSHVDVTHLYCPNCDDGVTNREAIKARIAEGFQDVSCPLCSTSLPVPKVAGRLNSLLSTEVAYQITNRARRLLARGEYLCARRQLQEIPREEEDVWKQLKIEMGFVFNFDQDEEQDRRNWENRSGQIAWRRNVWAAVSAEGNIEQGKSPKLATEQNSKTERGIDVAPQDAQKEIVRESPERKGEKLEQDTLGLLRQLFVFDDRDVVHLTKLRQQTRSAQLGCDIKLQHCRVTDNRDTRCLVECKSHEGKLRFADIVEKILDAEVNQAQIDHWILIAPRAHIIGNVPDRIVDEWNIRQKFPFQVQLWTSDTDVRKFFGLNPDVYDRWIDHPQEERHPREWTKHEWEHVKQSWLRRLAPPLRLPQAWAAYVVEKEGHEVFIENDDRKGLTALWQKGRYLSPGALDNGRSPLPASLMETVTAWLHDDSGRVCILLGDFGDGKTAFTYMLVRQLLDQFRRNPRDGWIPIRFPLQRFARPHFNARNLLDDRLKEFGAAIHEWYALVAKKNFLVILDGMDEMTKTLTVESVRGAVELLTDCCNREFEGARKVIITCRTPFFEELTQRRYVEDRLSNPRILYIERFDRRRVYEKLEQLATTPVQRLKLHSLRQMHDPIGLAGKALFLKMVSDNLADLQSDFSSETAIYQSYVDKSLREGRKIEFLEPGDQRMTDEELTNGLMRIMTEIALKIHLSTKDYLCLRKIKETDREVGKYAEILWRSMDYDPSSDEDALSRVGVRTLLHKRSQGVDARDLELWPVEFCHRSMREYFVARGIEEALRKGVPAAYDVLSKVDFNQEVLRFTAELMRRSGHDYHRTLRSLARMSQISDDAKSSGRDDRSECARLGRTSVTLLLRWRGELPEKDWSGLTLDGVSLAGAKLIGKDFRNTSLRSANLNNVNFINADFRGADLTGVRLEKTGEVCSLAVPRNMDGFYAAYRDGSIRYWCPGNRSGVESRVVYQIADTSWEQEERVQLSALPGDGLCVRDRDRIVFLDVQGDQYVDVATVRMRDRYLSMAFSEQGLSAVQKGPGAKCTVRLFDFKFDGPAELREWFTDRCMHCQRLGTKGLLAALETGAIVVYLEAPNGDEDSPSLITVAECGNPSAIASVRTAAAKQETYLVAIGSQDGSVGVWRLNVGESPRNMNTQEVFRIPLHEGTVTALAFVGDETLLTGGRDSKIRQLDIRESNKAPKTVAEFDLSLQCQGMKIAGMRGEYARTVLQAAGAE